MDWSVSTAFGTGLSSENIILRDSYELHFTEMPWGNYNLLSISGPFVVKNVWCFTFIDISTDNF